MKEEAKKEDVKDLFKEKWTQGVALTTTILAVCAALSTLKGGGYSSKTLLQTTLETNKWAHFQSKSTKQHICETQKDLLEIQKSINRDPETAKLIDEKLAKCNEDIERYDKEKGEIRAEAESMAEKEQVYMNHGKNFGYASMFLQIGIMLSGVGALTKRKYMWFLGIGVGIAGIIYLTNGFWLWF